MHVIDDIPVYVHGPTRWDYRIRMLTDQLYRMSGRDAPLDSISYCPPSMRRWFRELVHRLVPDIIFVNYAHWDGLLDGRIRQSTLCVIDTLDLLSQYNQRRAALIRDMPKPPIQMAQVDPRLLQEDYFERLGFEVSAEEYQIYDKYDCTIAITASDAEKIANNTRKTKVMTVPMSFAVQPNHNSYSGPALFPTGGNPFNIQAYLYFVGRVLPRVLEDAPSFCLEVTGAICPQVPEAEGILLKGFVPEMEPVYASARFLVCPILGKTGLQVKIIEAMANGLPIVTTRAAAEGTPVRHGVNGLIADNAAEFADHILRLWEDEHLCRQMGEASREIAASEFSQPKINAELSKMLSLVKPV